eukprot:CAMPEP_0198290434 /NCGR_PEP_ID=MMETSP1449-20131203/8306_1 /TAXON_ID=420275 /ORGANISM="Attheya septentrionalis, Strain CCMP2084" /LENGTH=375 /DNA_ID=CAMNT_0043988939 /DNA_START=81 /DNA_END=1205 /DNA_ORIENTATION=+
MTRAYLVFLFAVLATAWQHDDIRHSLPASAGQFASIAFVGVVPHFHGDHTMQKWKRLGPHRRNAASTVLSRRTQFSSLSKMTSQKAHDSDEESLLNDEKFLVSTTTMEKSQRCSWVGVPDVLESLPVHAELQARRSATIRPIIVPKDAVVPVANNSTVDSSFLERQAPHNFTIERLSISPPIFLLRNVLTSEECNTIMDAVSSENNGLLEDAETVSGNSSARPHSQVAWLPSSTEGIGELAWSMSQMLMPMSNGCEDMQVVHYKGNGKGEYHLHHDGNERFLTILYYLNGVGGTWFPFATTSDKTQPLLLKSRTEALQLASSMVPGRDGVVLVDAQTIVDGENRIPIAKGDAVAFYSYTKPNDSNADEEEYVMDW